MRCLLSGFFALMVGLGLVLTASAENVDLSTVPHRDAVELTIYNGEDLTLVRDIRTITVKKGINPLQFSWAGTQIDPSSVHLRFVTHADQLEVLETTFPHGKPAMLYWNVGSEFAGEVTLEISYFTSGISWTADYVGISNAAETSMNLEGFIRVQNNSGEEYENARVRLVVGTINLVEKIAQLAGIPTDAVKSLDDGVVKGHRLNAQHSFFFGGMGGSGPVGGPGGMPEKKEVTKEGLSEYFIYTIEGIETIPSGWSKRLSSLDAKDVPIRVEYRYRPMEYGDQLVRMYLMVNDEASHLGTTPLPNGEVRIFKDNGRDGLSFVTRQATKYIPIGDKFELNLGHDPEVIFELTKKRTFRDSIWLQINGTDQRRLLNGDEVIKVENASVVGWTQHEVFEQRVRNYSARPIEVEIRRAFPGDIVFRSLLVAKLHDFQTVELKTKVASGAKESLTFEVLQRHGTSAKQNNVTLEEGKVAL